MKVHVVQVQQASCGDSRLREINPRRINTDTRFFFLRHTMLNRKFTRRIPHVNGIGRRQRKTTPSANYPAIRANNILAMISRNKQRSIGVEPIDTCIKLSLIEHRDVPICSTTSTVYHKTEVVR